MEVIGQTTRKARKDHVCDWCGEIIEKGQKYMVSSCKNDDELYEWKNHLRCEKLYNELDMGFSGDGEGVDSDTFLQIVWERLREVLTAEEYEDCENPAQRACELLGIEEGTE